MRALPRREGSGSHRASQEVSAITEAVVVLSNAGGGALGGGGVEVHRLDIGQERDAETGVRFGDGNGSSETSVAGTDNDDVRRDHVHERRSATTFWYRPPK